MRARGLSFPFSILVDRALTLSACRTVGRTIDSAVAWFLLAEEQCKVSLLARAAGQPIPISDEEAEFTSHTGKEEAGFFLASPYFQVAEQKWGKEVRA